MILLLERKMGEIKVIMMMMVLLGIAFSVEGSRDQLQKWCKWKSRVSTGASSSEANPVSSYSSVLFKLYGNVHPKGFYYAQVNVGQPPKPYFLDPDTGSDLTWLQCDAPCVRCTKAPHPLYRPTNDLVVCRDPLCAALHSGAYECPNPGQCDYKVEYADGGSSLGVLVNDVFSLNLTTGIRLGLRLAFGCGYDQQPGVYAPLELDGVLGLGKGNSSIVSQLHNQGIVRNIIGHCLSATGGFLFFGDDLYDASQVNWTPMSRDSTNHYSVSSAELTFGGQGVGIKNLDVIFDSGSSYSYLNSQAYQAIISLIEKDLKGKPLKADRGDLTLTECWKGRKPFKSVHDVRKYFKPLGLSFHHRQRVRTQFEIPPDAYLIISSKGNACLGILNGTEIGRQNDNIIGDISMQDKMVIYDNEKGAIGWSPANCNRPPRSNTFIM